MLAIFVAHIATKDIKKHFLTVRREKLLKNF